MKKFITWIFMLMIVVHLWNGQNVFLDGSSFQVKETKDSITSKVLWLEVYDSTKNIVAIFPMEKVNYIEVRK